VYPGNTIWNFKIRLIKPVDLTTGSCEVGVLEFSYTSPASGKELQPIFLYWNLIGPQLVGDMLRRCLCLVRYPSPKGHRVSYNLYYLSVENAECQSIAIDAPSKLGTCGPFLDTLKLLVAVLDFVVGEIAYENGAGGLLTRKRICAVSPFTTHAREVVAVEIEQLFCLVYVVSPYVQRGRGIGSVLAGYFRAVKLLAILGV